MNIKIKDLKNRKTMSLFLIIIVSFISLFIAIKVSNNKLILKKESVDYIIDLEKFNISNTNTSAEDTTNGINEALKYASSRSFETVKLPKGHYAIDTSVETPITLNDGINEWTHNRKGIVMQSNMDLIMNDAILEMLPTNDPQYSILTISNSVNSKVIGGTILGDRDNHDYGKRINEDGDELESGSYDESAGIKIVDDTKVRTKEFINIKSNELVSNEFIVSVLENTTKNTVDGGARYIYCYDKDGKYLGMADGGSSFISKVKLVEGTENIKISFKDEKRLDAKYYITKELIYPTHEFGAGITIADSSNITIENVTIKDTIGDCITTIAPPLKVKVDDLKIINSTFENSRRQGISFVATGENYLIKGSNIGKINGVDPQSGIDIEHYDYVRNIIIEENNFYDNKKWDIINYNGHNIEIKNNNFTGGIGSTYGWNMDIHNNEFMYKDTIDNPKIYQGVVLAINTNKTNEDGAYFKINNNDITGYKAAGGTSDLNLSEFTGNKVYDTDVLKIQSPLTNGNIFENSNISYSTELIKNEIFKNSIVSIENDKFDTEIEESTFEDSQFKPRMKTTIRNSKIINKEKSFGDTTAWWNLETKTIFENSYIETQYERYTPFLSNYKSNVLFKNCDLNLSRSLFSLNYGVIEFEESNIIFNDYNESKDIIEFDKVGYEDEANYWKFTESNLESSKLIKLNTKNIFNSTLNENIIN